MRRVLSILVATAGLIVALLTPATASAFPGAHVAQPSVVAAPGAQSVYRFWSPTFKGHFYTIDPAERDKIIRTWPVDWSYEGERYTAYATQVKGTVPLYRFWSDKFKGHFYTADEAEKQKVIDTWPLDWTFEGVAYYVYPADSDVEETVAMSRFWSARFLHHFYTAENGERDRVIATWPNDWAYEGAKFRVPSADVAITPEPTRPADVDCSEFATWAAAQDYFGRYYAYYGDIARLDADGDLIACETLPGAP